MKKLMSIVISITMVFVMVIPAFAGGIVDLPEGPQREIAMLFDSAYQETAASDRTVETVLAKFKTKVNSDFVSKLNASTLEADVTAGINAALFDISGHTFTSSDITTIINEVVSYTNESLATTTSTVEASTGEIASETTTKPGFTLPSLPDFTLPTLPSIEAPDFSALLETFKNIFGGIIEIISGLFGGGGGGGETPTTPDEDLSDDYDDSYDDSYDDGSMDEEIPTTGDFALASVVSVALVAGVALVLTRKKRD